MDATQAIRVQRGVLQELDPDHDRPREAAFIELYAVQMREIINKFPEETGRDPTLDDIIWRLGEIMHEDPRVLMRCLICSELTSQGHEKN